MQFRTRTPAPLGFMPMPVDVPDLGDVTAIAAGGTHSLALLKDGTARAWGFNRFETVGDGIGQRLPIASNTDQSGRSLNRRVEVKRS